MPKDASPERLIVLLYQECSDLLKMVDEQKVRINSLEKTLKDRVEYLETCNATLASQRNKALRELRVLMDAFNKVSSEPPSAEVDNPCQ
jgi:membrane-bound ClpP family serine protease